MAYLRKRPLRRRRIRRTRRVVPKTKSGLKSLIKNVALKTCETKKSSHHSENVQLYHNGTEYRLGLWATAQGTSDPSGMGENERNRIGDEILARGCKFRWWISNKIDRPNVMYKVFVFLYNTNYTSMSDTIFWRGTDGDGATMNRMIDTPNPDRIKLLKSFTVRSGANYSVPENGHEHSYLKECWVPFNNKKVKYRVDGNNRPMTWDLGFAVVPYDSYGTLVTDNIASMAYSTTFYFKDP